MYIPRLGESEVNRIRKFECEEEMTDIGSE